MLRPVVGYLSLLLFGVTLVAVAQENQVKHDPWDQRIFTPSVTGGPTIGDGPVDQYPDPTTPPVPPGTTPNGDIKDPGLMISPAPQYEIQGGYASTADNSGYNNGGGVGVVMFMDGGRTGIQVGAQVAGTQGGIFAYAQGNAKIQYRMPIDKGHIIWGGVGLDIAGRGAVDPRVDSYLKVQLPVAFIGTMFAIGDKCVIHLFAKAAFGVFDNRAQSEKKWGANLDDWVKPAAGMEAMAACGSVRVQADYEHVFDFGKAGDTDHASLDFSQVFPVNSDGTIALGYFLKGDYTREAGLVGAGAGDARAENRNIGSFFGGFEVRFGASGKKP